MKKATIGRKPRHRKTMTITLRALLIPEFRSRVGILCSRRSIGWCVEEIVYAIVRLDVKANFTYVVTHQVGCENLPMPVTV